MEKELKAIFKEKNNILEVYYKDNLLFETKIENEDYWHGANIEGEERDFNFYKGENDYKLTYYPNVFVNSNGYYNTDCYEFSPVNLIII